MKKLFILLILSMTCLVSFAQENNLEQRVTNLYNQLKQLESDMKKYYIDEPKASCEIHDFKLFLTRAEGNLDTGDVNIYITIVNEGQERYFEPYQGSSFNSSITFDQHQTKKLASIPGHFAGGNVRGIRMMRRIPHEYVINVKDVNKAELIRELQLELYIKDSNLKNEFPIISFTNIRVDWTED